MREHKSEKDIFLEFVIFSNIIRRKDRKLEIIFNSKKKERKTGIKV